MTGTLTWKIDDAFKAMVAQAVKARETIKFVKDHGIYLMAFGNTPKQNKVVYANGHGPFDPSKDDFDTWWERQQRVCGGDDFAEDIPTDFLKRVIDKGCKSFKIKLTARRMSMGAA